MYGRELRARTRTKCPVKSSVVLEILLELARQARAGKAPALALVGIAACALVMLTAVVLTWTLSGSGTVCAVEGRAKFMGSPIEKGEVIFTPQSGGAGQRRSALIVAGVYRLPAERGLRRDQEHTVEIRALRPTGRMYRSQGLDIEELEQFLPPKFNTESDVKIRPTSSRNRIDFDLDSE